ncbi:MAG: MGMT family protein [Bacteroidetes bacterium]|nr:MGMT family protein [Bacteroidota bacterium]MBS1629590.1 MGMT family protein [Bacteroidota bacterium]
MAGKNEALYEAIYDIVRLIPRGRVTSYGLIAAAIGMKSGARMVGYALNHCHTSSPPVPAHRVLNRNGLLSGKAHFGAGDEMANLLQAEGIRVKDDMVQDFDQIVWDPSRELEL